jgi:hypothetical protein
MTRQTLETITRSILMSLGTFIIGKNLLGSEITPDLYEMVVGSVMSGVAILWGVLDKNLSIEMLQSFIRSMFVGFGGLLVAKGDLSAESLESYLGIAMAILTIVYSISSRKKNNLLVDGELRPEDLKK